MINAYQNLKNGTLNVVVHEWPPNLSTSLENSSFKTVDRSIMLHYHVLKHHCKRLIFVLLSNKPLTMCKDNVLSSSYGQWWTWEATCYPRCDGCLQVGVSKILVEIFMWINLSYSYGHFERLLLSRNLDHWPWLFSQRFSLLIFQNSPNGFTSFSTAT